MYLLDVYFVLIICQNIFFTLNCNFGSIDLLIINLDRNIDVLILDCTVALPEAPEQWLISMINQNDLIDRICGHLS